MEQLEEAYTQEGKEYYQGFLRSRDLEFLAYKLPNELKIRRLIIGGSTGHSSIREPIIISLKSGLKFKITRKSASYIDFVIFPVEKSAIRGKGAWGAYSLYDEKGLDLKDIYNKLSAFNPETLYIKEIEFTDEKTKLIFRDKRESDTQIRRVLEKSNNTKSCPLYLQRIHDKDEVFKIRKKYFKKLMTVAQALISTENMLKYHIVTDNYEGKTMEG